MNNILNTIIKYISLNTIEDFGYSSKNLITQLKNLSIKRKLILIVVVLFSILGMIIYFLYHPFYFMLLILFYVLAVIVLILYKPHPVTFTLNIKYLFIISFFVVVLLVNIYSILNLKELNTEITLDQLFLINKNILIYGFLSIFTVILYFIAIYSIGNITLSLIYRKRLFPENIEKLNETFLLGIVVSSTILFLLAAHLQINYKYYLPIAFIAIILNYKDNYFKIRGFTSWIINKKYNLVKLDFSIFILILSSFLTILVLLAGSLRYGNFGYDWLRAYMNMIKFLSENQELHITNTYLSYPFITEILMTPAFQAGNMPVTIVTTNVISSLFLLSAYLIIKKYTKSFKTIFIVLMILLTIPSIIDFYLIDYKTDLFLLYITVSIYLFLLRYLETKSLKYLYFVFLLLGYSFTVKLGTIFFLLPIAIYSFYLIFKTYRRKSIKHILILLILFILPILLWLIFYRFDALLLKPVGLGLSKNALDYDLPYYLENTEKYKCSFYDYELEHLYKYYSGIKRYLLVPFLYLRGSHNIFKISHEIGDTGGLYLLTSILLIVSYLILTPLNRIAKIYKNLFIILMISLLSLIIFYISIQVLFWYILSFFVLFYLIIFLIIIDKVKVVIPLLILIIVSIQFSIIFLADNYYFSLRYNENSLLNLLARGDRNVQLARDNYELDKILNIEPLEKVLFIYDYSGVNINYFFNDFYNEIIYIDSNTIISKNSLDELTNYYKIKYIIFNKLSEYDNQLECGKTHSIYYKNLLNQNELKIYENKSFILYLTR